eukprot:TRINITY_DN11858_c0_g1_i1.p1 TRINITY_DN11858_c0_g1~~TRINITY_DN11858_c0_g1_i1.p1  ORF type:complete len:268 (-),score=82.21 TRINITY_DN11858_c0_g1_i1:34-837(-)
MGTELDSILNLPETNSSLWSTIARQLPANRMLRGLPSPNVPLHVTINSFPAQSHLNARNEPAAILHLARDETSNFFSTISSDGTVNVWNADLALYRVRRVKLTEFFEPPSLEILAEMKIESKDSEEKKDNMFFGMFEMEQNAEDPNKGKKKGKNKNKDKETAHQESQSANIVPNPELVEQLYNMGFPIELAKKALIACKNTGTAQALDILFTLQDEEKKNLTVTPAKQPSAKTHSILKPEWACNTCTFIHVNAVSYTHLTLPTIYSV